MLQEAIAKIAELVTAGNDVQVLKIPGEAPSTLRLVKADGTVEVSEKTPPHRFIELLTLQDLIKLATEPFDKEWAERAIFFSMSEVAIVLNYKTGYEVARLKLAPSAEMLWFNERIQAPGQKVSDLVYACQTVIRGTRPPVDMDTFIAAVGKLSINGGSNASAEASRASSGFSKSVMATVQQPELMPQEIQTFSVRPFATPDIKYRSPLMCSLLPKHAECSWLIQPVPESVLEYQNDVLDHLRERLGQVKDVPLFAGRFDTTATK